MVVGKRVTNRPASLIEEMKLVRRSRYSPFSRVRFIIPFAESMSTLG